MIRVYRVLIAVACLTMAACASNPNKAEKIDTTIEKKDQISGDTALGIKEGNMVVQKKVQMSEELRLLQNSVYELEDRVYGNRNYGSAGLYGVLKECRTKLAAKENGGAGKSMWTEPIDRVTDKEEEFKIGLDEQDRVVGVSEEFLKDRIARFRNYKMILQKRQDEYEDKVMICKNEMTNRKHDKNRAEAKGESEE